MELDEPACTAGSEVHIRSPNKVMCSLAAESKRNTGLVHKTLHAEIDKLQSVYAGSVVNPLQCLSM